MSETVPVEPDIIDILRGSDLVDPDFYRAKNPDIAAAGVDPITHYAVGGVDEARNLNPFFDSARYPAASADVREAGLDPLYYYTSRRKC